MLDIPTKIEASNSWDSWGRIIADTADLVLPGIGNLECRYMRTGDVSYYVPHEVQTNRFGYLFVEINKSCTTILMINIHGMIPRSKITPFSDIGSLCSDGISRI